MEYSCVDVGRTGCPCILAESGECYVCDMLRSGHCGCGISWKGSCPYTEFVQNGGLQNVLQHAGDEKAAAHEGMQAEIQKSMSGGNAYCLDAAVKKYDEDLYVITAYMGIGMSVRFCEYGSFVMVQSGLGYSLPVSVMSAEKGKQADILRMAVRTAGPKSKNLIDDCIRNEKIIFTGPFYSGISRADRIKPSDTLVILRGVAAAPFINIMNIWRRRKYFSGRTEIFIDKHRLSDTFLDEYLGDVRYNTVNLDSHEDMLTLAESAGGFGQIIFFASPYHTDEFLKLLPERKSDIIISNSANMCCGEGICGACSYTDAEGRTIRKCKCVEQHNI